MSTDNKSDNKHGELGVEPSSNSFGPSMAEFDDLVSIISFYPSFLELKKFGVL